MPPRKRRQSGGAKKYGKGTKRKQGSGEEGEQADDEDNLELDKRRQKHDEAGLRFWKEDTYDGQKMRNVKFTKSENEQLINAYKQYLVEKGLEYDEHIDLILSEKMNRGGKLFNRIAAIADLPHRSVQACSKRLRRILTGSATWPEAKVAKLIEVVTKQLEEALLEPIGGVALSHPTKGMMEEEEEEGAEVVKPGFGSCIAYMGNTEVRVSVSWKAIAQQVDASAEQTRLKWLDIQGKARKGNWHKHETLCLRKGIVEVTNCMCPTRDVEWKKVQRFVPQRSAKQCMEHYYYFVAPRAVEYVSLYGMPIEHDVWDRYLIRNLKKQQFDDVGLISWSRVNKFLPASMNKRRFELLCVRLPMETREAELQEQLTYLYEVLECKHYKSFDKTLLKHAELSEEWRARKLEMEEEGELDEEEAQEEGEREEEEEYA